MNLRSILIAFVSLVCTIIAISCNSSPDPQTSQPVDQGQTNTVTDTRKAADAKPLPDWLPVYSAITRDHTDEKRMNFITSDPTSKVIEFYKQKLKANGFQVDSNPTSGGFGTIGGGSVGRLKAKRSKDGEVIEIELIAHEQTPDSTQVVGSWTISKK